MNHVVINRTSVGSSNSTVSKSGLALGSFGGKQQKSMDWHPKTLSIRPMEPREIVVPTFEDYIREATEWQLSGWNFDSYQRRWVEQSPSWSYRALVCRRIEVSKALLDMGTGGGEFLASIEDLPVKTYATDGYRPNVPIARARLEPMGIRLIEFESDADLPLENEAFDLIVNKHESFVAEEIFRILKPGGVFLTQQVGGRDNFELNNLLASPVKNEFIDNDLHTVMSSLSAVGFDLLDFNEEHPPTKFTDIGAVIVFLRAIPWQIPGFSIDAYMDKLFELHQKIQGDGELIVSSHRYFVEARKPDSRLRAP